MGKRMVGAILCLASALLFATRYLAAAIFMSGVSSWDRTLFVAGLEYVGSELKIASILFLLVGICYLIWAEIENRKER
ncbi:hypothetical protein [Agathobacter sp.]